MWTFWHSKDAVEREKKKVGAAYLKYKDVAKDRFDLLKLIRQDVCHGLMDTSRLLAMWLDDQLIKQNNSKE